MREFITRRLPALLISAVIGAAAALVILAVTALVCLQTGNFPSAAKFAGFAAPLVGGLCSGFIAGRKAGSSGILNGGIAALCCAAILALLSVFPSSEGGGTLLSPILCAVGGLAGGIAGVNLGA